MSQEASIDVATASADDILDALEMWGQKLGLERIQRLLEEVSSPHLAVPTVLVAGTNGKGSVTSLLARIARQAGYCTGAYYSPHLEAVEERIRVAGRTISKEQMGTHLRLLVARCQRSGRELPTYFEALTACAFLEFRRAQCDLAVLEVGLGGRLDATNVADPVLSLITNIALDHTEHLGETLRAIAHEKAGILRRTRPALVYSGGVSEVRSGLEQEARARGAVFEDVFETVRVTPLLPSLGGSTREPGAPLEVQTPRSEYRLETRLFGAHQHGNVALAVRAAECLAELGFHAVDGPAIVEGIGAARWPGRLEPVRLPNGLLVLLDGAHNPAGGRALAEALAAPGFFAGLSSDSGGGIARDLEIDLLFGTLAGKDAGETLAALAPFVRRLHLTEPAGGPRTLPVAELLETSQGVHWPRLVSPPSAHEDWSAALDLALDQERDQAVAQTYGGVRCLVVAGSLYLVGAVREALRERFGRPEATIDLVL